MGKASQESYSTSKSLTQFLQVIKYWNIDKLPYILLPICQVFHQDLISRPELILEMLSYVLNLIYRETFWLSNSY